MIGGFRVGAGALVLLVGSGATTTGLPVAADAPLLPPNPDPPHGCPGSRQRQRPSSAWPRCAGSSRRPFLFPGGTNWEFADEAHAGATLLSTTTAAAPLAAEISTYPGSSSAGGTARYGSPDRATT